MCLSGKYCMDSYVIELVYDIVVIMFALCIVHVRPVQWVHGEFPHVCTSYVQTCLPQLS